MRTHFQQPPLCSIVLTTSIFASRLPLLRQRGGRTAALETGAGRGLATGAASPPRSAGPVPRPSGGRERSSPPCCPPTGCLTFSCGSQKSVVSSRRSRTWEAASGNQEYWGEGLENLREPRQPADLGNRHTGREERMYWGLALRGSGTPGASETWGRGGGGGGYLRSITVGDKFSLTLCSCVHVNM